MDRRKFLASAFGLLAALAAFLLPNGGSPKPRTWKTASHWRRLAG
jgi:hypothetical protein